MYITFASAKIANKAEPNMALKPSGDVTSGPKKGHVSAKTFKKTTKRLPMKQNHQRKYKLCGIQIYFKFITFNNLKIMLYIPNRFYGYPNDFAVNSWKGPNLLFLYH